MQHAEICGRIASNTSALASPEADADSLCRTGRGTRYCLPDPAMPAAEKAEAASKLNAYIGRARSEPSIRFPRSPAFPKTQISYPEAQRRRDSPLVRILTGSHVKRAQLLIAVEAEKSGFGVPCTEEWHAAAEIAARNRKAWSVEDMVHEKPFPCGRSPQHSQDNDRRRCK